MLAPKYGLNRRYMYCGSGIFDTITNFLTRIFTSSAQNKSRLLLSM